MADMWETWKETVEVLRAAVNVICLPLVMIWLYKEWRKWDRQPAVKVADLTVDQFFYIMFLFFSFTWALL